MSVGVPYPPLYGVRLYGSANWPRKQIGVEEVRYRGHPLMYWLQRVLARAGVAFEPDIVITQPVYGDADVMLANDHLGGPAIFGSHRQIDRLIQLAKDGQTAQIIRPFVKENAA